jgi:hypothetical protein
MSSSARGQEAYKPLTFVYLCAGSPRARASSRLSTTFGSASSIFESFWRKWRFMTDLHVEQRGRDHPGYGVSATWEHFQESWYVFMLSHAMPSPPWHGHVHSSTLSHIRDWILPPDASIMWTWTCMSALDSSFSWHVCACFLTNRPSARDFKQKKAFSYANLHCVCMLATLATAIPRCRKCKKMPPITHDFSKQDMHIWKKEFPWVCMLAACATAIPQCRRFTMPSNTRGCDSSLYIFHFMRMTYQPTQAMAFSIHVYIMICVWENTISIHTYILYVHTCMAVSIEASFTCTHSGIHSSTHMLYCVYLCALPTNVHAKSLSLQISKSLLCVHLCSACLCVLFARCQPTCTQHHSVCNSLLCPSLLCVCARALFALRSTCTQDHTVCNSLMCAHLSSICLCALFALRSTCTQEHLVCNSLLCANTHTHRCVH